MNEVELTVRGNVTSDVRQVEFDDGNVLTSFRMASNVRRWDANQRENVTTHTVWLSVNCRRGLGTNAMKSLQKGQPIVVHGRLKQQKWTKDDRSGETTVIDADAIGHDLSYGLSEFTKVSRVERTTDNADAASQAIAGDLVVAEEDEDRARQLEAELGSAPWNGQGVEEDARAAVLA